MGRPETPKKMQKICKKPANPKNANCKNCKTGQCIFSPPGQLNWRGGELHIPGGGTPMARTALQPVGPSLLPVAHQWDTSLFTARVVDPFKRGGGEVREAASCLRSLSIRPSCSVWIANRLQPIADEGRRVGSHPVCGWQNGRLRACQLQR